MYDNSLSFEKIRKSRKKFNRKYHYEIRRKQRALQIRAARRIKEQMQESVLMS